MRTGPTLALSALAAKDKAQCMSHKLAALYGLAQVPGQSQWDDASGIVPLHGV